MPPLKSASCACSSAGPYQGTCHGIVENWRVLDELHEHYAAWTWRTSVKHPTDLFQSDTRVMAELRLMPCWARAIRQCAGRRPRMLDRSFDEKKEIT